MNTTTSEPEDYLLEPLNPSSTGLLQKVKTNPQEITGAKFAEKDKSKTHNKFTTNLEEKSSAHPLPIPPQPAQLQIHSSYDESQCNNVYAQQIVMENERKSPLHMAFMNMANSILGAGIISQPFAVKQAGVVGAFILYVVLGFTVDWTLQLIVQNLILSGSTTYHDSVGKAFGKKGKIISLLTIGSFAFGGCVGFCIIIGDTIPPVLKILVPQRYIERNWVIICTTLLISLPLSLHRNIKALENASFLALISMCIIVVAVVIRGPFIESSLKGQVTLFNPKWWVRSKIFKSVSIISFALVCHHNTSFIFYSLRNRSIAKFNKLTHVSCAISVTFCSIMGYCAFHIFKENTKGNVLNNFGNEDIIINVARLFFGFNMLTTFPLEIFVLRNIVTDIINVNNECRYENQLHSSNSNTNENGLTTSDHQSYFEDTENLDTSTTNGRIIENTEVTEDKYHTLVTVVLVLSAMSVSLMTCNLGALFELIGSTTASTIAYILPPMTNLRLTEQKKIGSKFKFYVCIVFGFLVMFISSIQTVLEALNNKTEKHCSI